MINVSTQKPFIENPQQTGIPPLCLHVAAFVRMWKSSHNTYDKTTANSDIIIRPPINPRTEHTLSQRKRHIKYP